jgi:7-cyano-7-deazaguanine synthase
MRGERADRVAVLASGGLDSVVLLADLARRSCDVHPIYVSCGLSWETTELAALERFLGEARLEGVRDVAVLDFPMGDVYGSSWYASGRGIPGYSEPDEAWEIPGRNIILLAKAAVWAKIRGVGRIAIGTLASNPFPDATPRFFGALEEALSQGLGLRIEVLRPFAGLHKADVVLLGRDLGIPLGLTLSCARPEGSLHCGTCGKCRERIDAFRDAGVPDPTGYAVQASGSGHGSSI